VPSKQNFSASYGENNSSNRHGARDFRTLAALMVKPRSSVMMTFAAEPNPGLGHERFSGPAVVFVSTVNYSSRAAVVQ
jgi:hypothetical protein